MKLNRSHLLKKSAKRPLHELRWQDLRGSMRDFQTADIVMVSDAGKVRIMKDRQGQYQHLIPDANGLYDEAQFTKK